MLDIYYVDQDCLFRFYSNQLLIVLCNTGDTVWPDSRICCSPLQQSLETQHSIYNIEMHMWEFTGAPSSCSSTSEVLQNFIFLYVSRVILLCHYCIDCTNSQCMCVSARAYHPAKFSGLVLLYFAVISSHHFKVMIAAAFVLLLLSTSNEVINM